MKRHRLDRSPVGFHELSALLWPQPDDLIRSNFAENVRRFVSVLSRAESSARLGGSVTRHLSGIASKQGDHRFASHLCVDTSIHFAVVVAIHAQRMPH